MPSLTFRRKPAPTRPVRYSASAYPCRRTLYVDVDGVLWIDGRVNEDLVAPLRELRSLGWTLVVWSSAGGDHAREVADAAGLGAVVCLAKPDAVLDDAGWSWTMHKPVLDLQRLIGLVAQEREREAREEAEHGPGD